MYLFALVVLSLAFAAAHIGMSAEPFRGRTVDKLGEIGFRGLYSLVSLVTLGGAIWVFTKLPTEQMGPVLWKMPGWLVVCPLFIMLIAIPMLVFGFIQPSPTGMRPASMEPKGIIRVTRHPVNMAIGLFGLAHMLASGRLGQVAFFGAIFIVGFVGAYHQDRRKTREIDEEFEHFKTTTSVFPFAAIIIGRNRLERGEFSKPVLVASVIIWLAALVLHKKILGVGIIP